MTESDRLLREALAHFMTLVRNACPDCHPLNRGGYECAHHRKDFHEARAALEAAPSVPTTWCAKHHEYDHCEDAALARIEATQAPPRPTVEGLRKAEQALRDRAEIAGSAPSTAIRPTAEGLDATERQRAAAVIKALHERSEAFNPPNGRGLTFPGAWSLDHSIGGNPEGCDGCIEYARLSDHSTEPA